MPTQVILRKVPYWMILIEIIYLCSSLRASQNKARRSKREWLPDTQWFLHGWCNTNSYYLSGYRLNIKATWMSDDIIRQSGWQEVQECNAWRTHFRARNQLHPITFLFWKVSEQTLQKINMHETIVLFLLALLQPISCCFHILKYNFSPPLIL